MFALRPLLADGGVGIISDVEVWQEDGAPVMGVVGNRGIALLDTGGTVRSTRDLTPPDEIAGGGNLRWFEMDGVAPPELVTLEAPMLDHLAVYSCSGERLLLWRLPPDIKAPFGIKAVHPFLEGGERLFAVWVGLDTNAIILDSKGKLLERRTWGSVNSRETVARSGSLLGDNASIYYADNTSLRGRTATGSPAGSLDLPKPHRYINLVVPIGVGDSADAFLIRSTYGATEQRYSLVRGMGSAVNAVAIPDGDVGSALGSRCGARVDFEDGNGRRLSAAATLVGPGQSAELAIGDGRAVVQRIELPPAVALNGRAAPVRLLMVPRDATEPDAVWLVIGNQLFELARK